MRDQVGGDPPHYPLLRTVRARLTLLSSAVDSAAATH